MTLTIITTYPAGGIAPTREQAFSIIFEGRYVSVL